MTPQDGISYRRWFPWLNLFQAIGIAFSLRQLTIAAGAICVLSAWDSLIGSNSASQFNAPSQNPGGHAPMREQSHDVASLSVPNVPASVAINRLDGPGKPLPFSSLHHLSVSAAQPWKELVFSVAEVLGRHEFGTDRIMAVCGCVWVIAVWALFGVAICRLAARRFAKQDGGSFRKAVQFGLTRWIRGIVAPLIPTAAAALILGFATILAFAGRLPWVGSTLAILMSPALAVCGLIAGFLLIAMLLGWPLMLAAITYDDCDGFGGLSRSYSHWTGRPWYFLWSWAVGGCAGAVAMLLAYGLGNCTVYLCSLVIESGMGETPAAASAVQAIEWLVQFVLHAYAISFFWTTSTIVYALLRQSVDWMPPDVLAPDDDERPPRDPLPVVGIPAMQPPAAAV